ncbi:methylated-DNA--protein-cysteine methyltransferase [mine drainage metagenome]|uniref:methylated-DNA--[protein]-cysteine S-methyltransferase n=1 Tax=mine drainage metagenome TaxID=410659 RepID=T1D675_9ZZZZ
MERKEMLRKLERCNLTQFQRKVLLATFTIPEGETRTYKQVAEMAGYPGAARAVGSAMRINPFAPTIPCHRVIRSDGSVGNYSAAGGRKKKIALLKKERAI